MDLILKSEDQEVKVTVINATAEKVLAAIELVSESVEITEWVGPRPKK